MKSTLFNMVAVLFGITLVASAGVGVVNMITVEPIAQAELTAKADALKQVLPPFDGTSDQTLTIDEIPVTVYTATRDGEVTGYAVESMSKNGFGGEVRLMVGFAPDGEVINVNVLRQTETPGLGTKMADEGNVLLASIQGKNLEQMKLVDGKLAVRKDGGDDVDVTTGLPVVASVVLEPDAPGVRILGGEGVGRVTKPGLDQPVGEAAINHVPRQMIAEALEREAENAAYTGGFAVTISVEGGAETAKRTFNPHIGVEGGLSILGTSGIVEPMSQQAILDTIQLEMNQAALRAKNAPGPRRLVLAPGNYGLDYLASALPQFERFPVVKTSNFIGDTLDMAATAKFEEVLLVGHVGKLCKLAAGVMNTHSHTADGRAEVFCAHAALCGAAHEVCAALMDAATTDACLDILDGAQLRAPVLESILAAIQMHLDRRAGGAFRVGAVLFSNQHGPLGETKTAKELMQEWQN